MSLSVTPQASPLGARLVEETSSSATPVKNATGASGTIFMIEVDNVLNGTPVYLKVYDNANPTVGTTPADFVLKVPANGRRAIGIPLGLPFTAALSFATVTGAAESNTASPGSAVIARFLTS